MADKYWCASVVGNMTELQLAWRRPTRLSKIKFYQAEGGEAKILVNYFFYVLICIVVV